ncbi:MAG: NUDIX domain-containing protein [Alphaproteobacteria bacterium]|nr:NUDIX domain-containing protein [Alphaproteobacteria bacterium]
MTAELIETDFSSFLFWKDTSYPEAGVRDGFGSAMIRSREGHVLLARQLAGHLNSGLLYLPGGFIDLNDVCGDGRVDIDASIMRELAEETGLGASSFVRRPGYLLTRVGVQVSIAVEFRSELDALELRHLLCSQLRAQGDPELADFVIFDRPPEPSQTDVVAFSRHAIEAVFSGL